MNEAAQPPRRGENWAFWLGIASLGCLGPITGVLAVIVGAVVLGRAKGARSPLALAGVIAGALGTAAGVLALLVGADLLERRNERLAVTAAPASPPQLAFPDVPDQAPVLPPGHPPISPKLRTPLDEPAAPTSVGNVGETALVQVGEGETRSLEGLVAAYRREQQPLLLYVRAPRCAPCKRFEATLTSPLMQAALGKSVLLALDAATFEGELEALRIDTRDVPTFVNLSDAAPARALDAITGAEWDDDLPQNIAPIFSRFLAGTLQKRRMAPPFVGTLL